MATKNLARTVIEGGRAPRNRIKRRKSNQVARRRDAGLVQAGDEKRFGFRHLRIG